MALLDARLSRGLMMIVLFLRGTVRAPRVMLALLGLMWIVCGAAYHWAYFTQINAAARGFALAFVIEGALLIAFAVTTDVRIYAGRDLRTALALATMVYGLALYSLVGWIGRQRGRRQLHRQLSPTCVTSNPVIGL